MITQIKFLISVATLLILLSGGIVHALTFTVSDINFSNLTGNSQDIFNWRVIARNDRNKDLTVGDKWNFTYGYFRVNDFPISFAEENDTDDSFTSNFSIHPSAEDFDITGMPVAVQGSETNNDPDGDYVYLNFSDSITQQFAFGDGGLYTLKFLNPLNSLRNTYPSRDFLYDSYRNTGEQFLLRAQITYDAAPVPEPGTLVLLGAGLVGLAVLRRRKL